MTLTREQDICWLYRISGVVRGVVVETMVDTKPRWVIVSDDMPDHFDHVFRGEKSEPTMFANFADADQVVRRHLAERYPGLVDNLKSTR